MRECKGEASMLVMEKVMGQSIMSETHPLERLILQFAFSQHYLLLLLLLLFNVIYILLDFII